MEKALARSAHAVVKSKPGPISLAFCTRGHSLYHDVALSFKSTGEALEVAVPMRPRRPGFERAGGSVRVWHLAEVSALT
jgi:hypothetical protein